MHRSPWVAAVSRNPPPWPLGVAPPMKPSAGQRRSLAWAQARPGPTTRFLAAPSPQMPFPFPASPASTPSPKARSKNLPPGSPSLVTLRAIAPHHLPQAALPVLPQSSLFPSLLAPAQSQRSQRVRPGGSALRSGGSRPSRSASVLTVTCRRSNYAIHHPNWDIFESERDVYKKVAKADSLFLAHIHIL